jgi:hypothetical protein
MMRKIVGDLSKSRNNSAFCEGSEKGFGKMEVR